jgi:hypothetical protein
MLGQMNMSRTYLLAHLGVVCSCTSGLKHPGRPINHVEGLREEPEKVRGGRLLGRRV